MTTYQDNPPQYFPLTIPNNSVPDVAGYYVSVTDAGTTNIFRKSKSGGIFVDVKIGEIPKKGSFVPAIGGSSVEETQYFSGTLNATNLIRNQAVPVVNRGIGGNAGGGNSKINTILGTNLAPPADAPTPAADGVAPAAGESTTTQSDTSISKPLEDQSLFSTSTGASEILRYPLNNDGGYDFLKITTHELNRSEDLLGGKGFKLKSPEDNLSNPIGNYIALPMQPGISDSNSVDWGADQLNPIQLALSRAAYGAMGPLAELNLQGAGENVLKVLKEATAGLLGDINETDIKAYFAGRAVGANIFTRSTGKVINPNLELLFRGPQLRTFNYSYRFTPREEKESKVIKQIIRHFKKHMAARRNNVGLFLKTPYVFKLTYVYSQGGQHPFLNKIKPCALTNFNVDYTPDGSYATYTDGSMTSYTVSMQFSEIAPIYEDDYKDTDNDMGY